MQRPVRYLFGICLILSLLGSTAFAQATGQISGRVSDPTGALLPGVDVTATQTETGIARAVVTDETGTYTLANLAIGPYRLEAAIPGFSTFVQTGIVLQVNSSPVINITLQVGQVTERVEVQANALMVETRTVGVGTVIENERILELPLNGRQVTELIALAGAAVHTGTGSGNLTMAGSAAVSVAGGLTTSTTYSLDGAMHNNPADNRNIPFPFPDALEEFRVETGGLASSQGMYSGGAVNAVTKSGTNDLHGSLFEFLRNDLFNARNYFATRGSTLKRNQYGGTIGGPIVQNKMFFFGGYQGMTIRSDPADLQSFVPTESMLRGDFSAFASAACQGTNRNIPTFSNNQVNPALFSAPALAIVNKLPRGSEPCGLVIHGQRSVTDEHHVIGKVDYQLNERQSLFSRVQFVKFDTPTPFDLNPSLLNASGVGNDQLSQSYALGHTFFINPKTIHSFRVAVNRVTTDRTAPSYFSAPDIGIKIYSYQPKNMSLNITGAGNCCFGGNPGPSRTTAYYAGNDLNIQLGTHQMGIGTAFAYWRNNINAFTGASRGTFQFNGTGLGTGSLGWADFMLGRPSRFSQRAANTTYTSQPYAAVYFSDSWRMTPRVTLNYGARWEPYFPQVYRNGKVSNFNEERYAARIHSTVFANAPFGFYYPGDSGFPGVDCRESGICNASGVNGKWLNVMPRLGLGWDVEGNGRTSVRASYALGYDMITALDLIQAITPPWEPSVVIERPEGGFVDPYLNFPGGNPFPVGSAIKLADTPFPAFSDYFSIPYDNPRMTRNAWNLSIQRQIATDWLASVSYLGSQLSHAWGSRELNSAIFFPGNFDGNRTCTVGSFVLTGGNPGSACSTTANVNQRRRLAVQYPNVGGTPMGFVANFEANGTQTYNGVVLSIQRRAASGLSVSSNYTWSHCYGDNQDAGTNPGNTYIDPNNRDFDRGNCDTDRRHILNATMVAQSPQFSNPTMRALGTGWRLSGIYRWQSGSYRTVTSGVNQDLTGVSAQRPNQVLENPYGDKSLNNYLNRAAFQNPAQGSVGTLGPSNIKGPNYWTLDAALSRSFQFKETHRLEFRAEAYNVTNSLRPGNPDTTLNSNQFGRITTAEDPRIMQFALKYIF